MVTVAATEYSVLVVFTVAVSEYFGLVFTFFKSHPNLPFMRLKSFLSTKGGKTLVGVLYQRNSLILSISDLFYEYIRGTGSQSKPRKQSFLNL